MRCGVTIGKLQRTGGHLQRGLLITERASGLYVRSLPLSRNPFYDADRLALLAPTVGLWDVSFTSCDVQKGRFACVTGECGGDGGCGTGNESVPIQLARCWFPGLAISNAKI